MDSEALPLGGTWAGHLGFPTGNRAWQATGSHSEAQLALHAISRYNARGERLARGVIWRRSCRPLAHIG